MQCIQKNNTKMSKGEKSLSKKLMKNVCFFNINSFYVLNMPGMVKLHISTKKCKKVLMQAMRKMHPSGYLAGVEVIELVKGDGMVWAIDTCVGISKYMRKYKRSVLVHQR